MGQQQEQQLFREALSRLESKDGLVGETIEFSNYAAEQGFGTRSTAQHISVNKISELNPLLREAKTMVFRLGSTTGSGRSCFALARSTRGLSDYFLIDSEIFTGEHPKLFLPDVSARALFAYELLPNLTESSFVNLALASGLMHEALGLDERTLLPAPATGRGVFSFTFRPHEADDESLRHIRGQVEIDALFVGKRNGEEHLFVVEAKHSKHMESLAKHKLAYPVLALQSSL